MSDSATPQDFHDGHVVEWCNQIGRGSYRNGRACVIDGPLYFREGINDVTGEVDFGWGYDVTDVEDGWFAFVRELRPRQPPDPDWVGLCRLDTVAAIACAARETLASLMFAE